MYCIQTDLSCIAINLLILCFLRKKESNKDRVNEFRALLISIILVCISDALIYIFDVTSGIIAPTAAGSSDTMLNISSFLYYCFAGFAGMFGTYYIVKSCGVNLSKWQKILGMTPQIVLCVLSFCSMFYNLIFYIENNTYARGEYNSIHAGVTVIYLVAGIAFCINNFMKKQVFEEKLVEMSRACVIVMPIVGTIVQSAIYGTLLIWPLSTFAVLLIYLTTIQHESNYDELTDLYRKKVFESNAERIICSKIKSALIIIDIDDFKRVNDIYGHRQGDLLLKLTAEKIRYCFSKKSLIGRIGGDEFSVLVYNYASIEEIENICGDFLTMIGKDIKDIYQIEYSCSMGISENIESLTFQDAYQNSDKALYDAKRSGRNCYKVFNPEITIGESKNTVLIVDNDEFSSSILSSYLDGKCSVIEVKDGISAINTLKKYKNGIGLIFLNLTLPHMDGYQVIEKIKKESLFDLKRIVIKSPPHIDEKEIDRLGVYGSLLNPFNPQITQALLNKFILIKD